MNRQWKAGIEPQKLTKIVNNLYISEQVGGYEDHYRPVRRDVEITWLLNQEFDLIVSLLPTTQNLQNYSKKGLNYIHHPVAKTVEVETLIKLYQILYENLAQGRKILMHRYKRADLMAGIMAGFFLYTNIAQEKSEAILRIENLFCSKIEEDGNRLVKLIANIHESNKSKIN